MPSDGVIAALVRLAQDESQRVNDWTEGEVIADRYRLEARLGAGGMGEVWRAEHIGLASKVALKRIHLDGKADAERRFMREAQASAQLRGPGIVQVLDYGVDRGAPYIAMELLEGESLADRLERTGKLEPADLAWIIADVVRGMARAHKKGIAHRDLKPDNIFLVADDEGSYAKVVDFGIMKSLPTVEATTATSATASGALLGTPCYMSPEQAEGESDIDHRTDLWSLGVISFECLTGRRPFDAESIGKLVLQICSRPISVPSSLGPVPDGFDAWFARATERDKDKRFQSAAELGDALSEVLVGEPISRRGHPSSRSDEVRASGRHRVAASSGASSVSSPVARTTSGASVDTAKLPLASSRRGVAVLVGLGVVVAAMVVAVREPNALVARSEWSGWLGTLMATRAAAARAEPASVEPAPAVSSAPSPSDALPLDAATSPSALADKGARPDASGAATGRKPKPQPAEAKQAPSAAPKASPVNLGI